MEDKENAGVTSEDVIEVANNLLTKCNVDFAVKSMMQCNSDLFLALFHVILGDYPAGAILESYTTSAKLHNVKCVIDALAEEYLHVDLSHINPEEVLNCEPLTVYNLIEILDGLFDYFVEQISVDKNSDDRDDTDTLSDMAQQMVFDTIQQEIGETTSIKRVESSESQDTNELIALGESDSDEFVPLTPSTASSYAQWHELSTLDEITEHSLNTSDDTITEDEQQQQVDETQKSLTNVLSKLQDLKFDQRDPARLTPSTVSNISDGSSGKFLELPQPSYLKTPLSKQVITMTESDSGGSMTSGEKLKRLNVELNDKVSQFELKDKSFGTSVSSADVADGKIDDDDNLRPPSSVTKQSKDWQALLTSLQQTVEESKKIREKYFTSLNESLQSEREVTESSILSDDDEISSVMRETYPKATRRKNVRFEDTISTNTAKELKLFQEELKKERRLQETKNKILKNTFQQHLQEVREDGDDKMSSMRTRVKQTEREVTQKQSRQYKRKPVKRLAGVATKRHWTKQKSHIPSGQKITKRISNQLCIGEHDLLPQLLEQFPGLELTPATLNDMWTKQFRQIEHLTNAATDHKHKIRQKEKQLTEGHMKHSLLIDIMQRQHDQQKRVKEIKIRENEKREAKRVIKDRRLHTARIRKYYRDYHVQMKSKMLRRRTKEERIFKQLFEEGLNIQKSRLRELRSYATEKRSDMNNRLRNEIASLENYYKDQFNMLAETIATEKNNLQVRDKAQTKLLRRMKQGLRQKMEAEIGNLQEMIARDDEDVYYREVEADRVRRQLQIATYNSKFMG